MPKFKKRSGLQPKWDRQMGQFVARKTTIRKGRRPISSSSGSDKAHSSLTAATEVEQEELQSGGTVDEEGGAIPWADAEVGLGPVERNESAHKAGQVR